MTRETTPSTPPKGTKRRFFLWSLPVVVTVAGFLGLSCAEEMSRLAEADAFLAVGETAMAERLFGELAASPVVGARARAGLRIAEALGARPAGTIDFGPETKLDPSPYPLTVLARRAFDRGDFDAVLALDSLSAELGRSTVPVLATAARIESGRLVGESGPKPIRARKMRKIPSFDLALRVDHYLASHRNGARDGEGVILRDRRGRRLGHLTPEGEMILAADVSESLIPRVVPEAVLDHTDAPSVRLSLDLELAELAMESFGYYRGSIVLVDPASGEILAAVSDRRSLRKGGSPAFEEYREPASISKLITTTATLRDGRDPDAEISRMRCRGHRSYAGELLYCPYIAGRLRGLDRALAVSCNVAFADLGVAVGRRKMLEELRLYGFGVDLGGFPGGRILEPEGDERQLADISIGLDHTEMTPLHAALLAAVMANDGVMPTPTLIHAEDGRLGLHPRLTMRQPGRRIVDPEWLPMILGAMEAVAERGTAKQIAPANFPVAMKTGTASHPRYGFHVNYIGVGPTVSTPRIAFAVRITHQGTSKKVRYAARVVTRRLLRRLGAVAEERGWLEPPPESGRPDVLWALHDAPLQAPLERSPMPSTPAETSRGR